MTESSVYEQDVAIDEGTLDIEWLRQPELMFKYCRLQAEAQRDMNLAKERQDFVAADLNRSIRSDPEAAGIVAGPRGITEDAIKSAIQVHEDYQAAITAYVDAKYEYEVVVAAVRSFDHKKTALENLVRLHGQSYFAGPQIPHDLTELRQQRDQRVQSRVRMKRGAGRG